MARIFHRKGLAIALFFVTLAVLYGPSLADHISHCAKLTRFNDDARQHIPPFLHYYDDELFADDYISEYLLDVRPVGYHMLYKVTSAAWDPRVVSEVLPYILFVILLVAMALSVRPFGGWPAAWMIVTLTLSTDFFLDRMMGGLSRSFSFPLLACAAAAFVHGRTRWVVVFLWLATALYTPTAVAIGLGLSLILIMMPSGDRGDSRTCSPQKRIAVVCAAAMVSGLIALPTVIRTKHYGEVIHPPENSAYPEASSGGRLHRSDRTDFNEPIGSGIKLFSAYAFKGRGEPWSPRLRTWIMNDDPPYDKYAPRFLKTVNIILILCMVAMAWVAMTNPAGRRLLAFTIAVMASYLASRILAPALFLPQRFLYYPTPVLVLIWLTVFASILPDILATLGGPLKSTFRAPCARTVSVLSICLICLAFLGGRVNAIAGIRKQVSDEHLRLSEFIGTLPKDALIAGWPTELDSIPYLSARKVYLSEEVHLCWHSEYMDVMRDRFRNVLDAYYATNATPLAVLRDEEGVTHFVINNRHLAKNKRSGYFDPFNDWINEIADATQGADYEVLRQRAHAQVFKDGSLVVLDLSRLQTTTSLEE